MCPTMTTEPPLLPHEVRRFTVIRPCTADPQGIEELIGLECSCGWSALVPMDTPAVNAIRGHFQGVGVSKG